MNSSNISTLRTLRHVFGRTLLCRDLTVATEMAKTTGFDCVTTSGDKVSARGPLSGGYFDSTRSKMTVQRMRTRIDENMRECEEEISNLQAEILETEKKVVEYVTQIQKAEIKNSKAKCVFVQNSVAAYFRFSYQSNPRITRDVSSQGQFRTIHH